MTDQNQVISPFLGDHDHSHCESQALEVALEQCRKKGLKLTKIRQQVLEIIWSQHNPIGAYDVLQQLQAQGHKPAPPTAYRALEFLVDAKLIHRIESLNAYIGCPSPESSHQCQFYICRECGHIAELNNSAVSDALSAGAADLGFRSQQPVIEVHGICRACQAD
ncbi:Fur family transcriptional regulator [Arenicella xantha]|uniref:Fur family zinc uptake transcriptional regulator n=1 Tax=Arenicella xantha TaxID=644221 RepID=A0A395JUB2_9GAMM|nr:Fur family transcriptional regulator [Arenicella xantha]RBP53128.1 Fur family zinc uptake transcriptional regulator [Arenicella xantha]